MRFLSVKSIGWLLLALLLVALGASVADAQTGGYTLVSWSIDSGVGEMSGGGFTVNAVAGQPDVGTINGGGFTMSGGFVNELAPTPPVINARLYLPIALR